jgi:hypothetical protein
VRNQCIEQTWDFQQREEKNTYWNLDAAPTYIREGIEAGLASLAVLGDLGHFAEVLGLLFDLQEVCGINLIVHQP